MGWSSPISSLSRTLAKARLVVFFRKRRITNSFGYVPSRQYVRLPSAQVTRQPPRADHQPRCRSNIIATPGHLNLTESPICRHEKFLLGSSYFVGMKRIYREQFQSCRNTNHSYSDWSVKTFPCAAVRLCGSAYGVRVRLCRCSYAPQDCLRRRSTAVRSKSIVTG